MKRDYSIFLISNKPEKYAKIQESMLPELLYYFDGTGAANFSQLVNRCVEASPTETVIILSDRMLPTQADVQRTVSLLDKGFGFVGLYRYGFFGFKKELMRKIGMFDERYVGGGYEDYDFTLRLSMANIACVLTEDVTYIPGTSSWDYSKSIPHWVTKWEHDWDNGPDIGVPLFNKALPEEVYDYDLGPSVPTNFLKGNENTYVNGGNANFMLAPLFRTVTTSSVPIGFINE